MLKTYLQLRLIVGYLGERAQFGWWPTAFFDRASRLFLEPVFSKTVTLAQYHGVREAARRLHDEHIGIGNVYHLFRLPEEIEQDLHNVMHRIQHDDAMLAALQSMDAALRVLTEIGAGAGGATEDPIAIGKLSDLWAAHAQQANAQSYLSAFRQGSRTYPYFAG